MDETDESQKFTESAEKPAPGQTVWFAVRDVFTSSTKAIHALRRGRASMWDVSKDTKTSAGQFIDIEIAVRAQIIVGANDDH